jgi:nitroreductase
MDVLEAIRQRKSIRGFTPDPVPRNVLADILEVACRAPSAMNTQPWEFAVLTGEPLDELKSENIRALREHQQAGTLHSSEAWPRDSVYRSRQVALAKQLFGLMNITRDDKDKRADWTERGFRYFDAPAAIVVCVDSMLDLATARFDVGCLVQNICLAALSYDLGTCIEDQGVMFPDVVRKVTGLSETKEVVIGLAIGTPDWDFPANQVVSDREPVQSITTWLGFS